MKFAIGKKIGMTRIFDSNGKAQAATIVSVIPIMVSKIMTKEKEGYQAIQVTKKELKKEDKDKQSSKKTKYYEFRVDDAAKYKIGEEIPLDNFNEEDNVTVVGNKKGKGFMGVVKRYNFHIGPISHGSNHQRSTGSIGGAYPQRVFAGKKMPGRDKRKSVTEKSLALLHIDKSLNTMIIAGSVPGPKKAIVKIMGIK